MRAWLDHSPRIVSLQPNSLDDVWNDIRRVAESLEDGSGEPFHEKITSQRGKALIDRLSGRMAEIGRRAASLDRPGVAALEWIDPLMAAGNWMPELIAMAGGVDLFGQAGKHSPWMTFEQLENEIRRSSSLCHAGSICRGPRRKWGP